MKLGVSYFGNRNPRWVRKDLKEIRRRGFDYVVHTFSENDLLFYRGTMKDIVEMTKENGLEAWLDPWGVGRVFGGEAFSYWALRYPEIRQVDENGEALPAACPSHPFFREMMEEWFQGASETGAEVFFADEPHFFSSTFIPYPTPRKGCFCSYCRQYAEISPLLDFILFLMKSAKKMGMRTGICLLPEALGGDESHWEWVVSIPELDVFGTDPYWLAAQKPWQAYISSYAHKIYEMAMKHGKISQLWIQGFKVPAGREAEVGRAITLAGEAGIGSIAIWGYEACAQMSSIAPENPKKVWQVILKEIQKIKRKKEEDSQ